MREISFIVGEALQSLPVVAITGVRQAGKTTFLQNETSLRGRRYATLDDFDQREAALRDPRAFLAGDEPLTIDEAQRIPEIFTAVKAAVDRDRRPGRFLLSGSANFALHRRVSESLAGRALYLTLHPMSRREILGRTGPPFLAGLFAALGRSPDCDVLPATRNFPEPIAPEEILRGGMPPVALGAGKDPALWFRGFEQTYVERDLRDLSHVADLVSFRRLLRLAAFRTGQILNQSEIGRDVKLNNATAGRYLGLLETSFLVARLPPFLANDASRLIKSPKLFLSDSGLAAHLMGLKGFDPGNPLQGALLETHVHQNLRAILDAHLPDARLAFWHVQGRQEVDFVIEEGKACLALEVKNGARWDEGDLAGLRAFLDRTPGCRGAILGFNGRGAPVKLGPRLWAVPLGLLLG